MEKKAVREASFLPPRFSMPTYTLLRIVGKHYLRIVEGISKISTINIERLYRGIREHQDGKSILLVLFRHTAKEDAPVLLGCVMGNLAQWCRKNGKKLKDIPHVHFLYGKDVLNWAGQLSRWLLPRIGGIPVINHKVYRPSMDAIKRALKEGRFPLAFAPEAQVTYHMFRTSEIAAGATVFTRWAQKENKKVTLLPVAIGYSYREGFRRLILDNIEVLSTFLDEKAAVKPDSDYSSLRETLLFLSDRLVSGLEKIYGETCPETMHSHMKKGSFPNERERVLSICDRILSYGEKILEIKKQGDILGRIFRLRYKIVNAIYREDVDPETLPPMEKTWADYRAFTASYLKRHEEIIDALEYLDPSYIDGGATEKSTLIRMAEFSMILRDITNRIGGGNIDSRYSPKGKTAHLLFGEPIDIPPSRFGSTESRREADENIHLAIHEALEKASSELEREMGKQ